VSNKRNNRRKLKSFDENNRNSIKTQKMNTHTHTHNKSPSNYFLFIYTKLRGKEKKKNIETVIIRIIINYNYDNTYSCLECGETPTREKKQNEIQDETTVNLKKKQN